MRALFVLRLALVAGAVSSFGALPARAQVVDDSTRNTARDLAAQAKEAFSQGDFEKAQDLSHRAYTLVPAPTIALYEARSLEKLHRFVEAEEAYMRAVRTSLDQDSPEQFRVAVRTAEGELLALRPKIPKLLVALSGPGGTDPNVRVLVDGTEMKRAVLGVETQINPGDHRIGAQAPGGEEVRLSFTIAEKEHKKIELEVPQGTGAPVETGAAPIVPTANDTSASQPPPATRDPGSTQRMLGIAAAGVGVAGLATGIITGLMAASRHSDVETMCPNRTCEPGSDGADALDSFHSLRTVSTVGYIVGGVGLAGGAALYFTAPKEKQVPTAAVGIRPYFVGTGAGVVGVF